MTDQEASTPGRRAFLKRTGQVAALSLSDLATATVQKALAIAPARVTGTIADVQHVVILMQENRSFDHYFGTMAGVRGFGDRHVLPQVGGRNVWQQSDGARDVLPFHLDTQTTTAMRVPGTPHSWPDAQLAWNHGRFGEWARHKRFQSMGYYEEDDIPFQRALAGAFTICDAHHCSVQGGTLPNRVVFMTGTHVTPGLSRAAVDQTEALIDNSNNRGARLGLYRWTSYPERLLQAGVSWRIYQDPRDNWGGLLAPWESFAQYREASEGSPLCDCAMTDWSLVHLADHVQGGTLPQVSWVIPSPVWSEHPSASSPLQGASYTQQVLDILISNPEVWSKTVLIVTFDENDGFFDHVPPPAVPSHAEDGSLQGKTTLEPSIEGEYYTNQVGGVLATRPYGMGPRVPMYLVSPWSRGGWVSSEVFDHTSTIRFLEARFGVHEPNITPWHRAVSGDLTRCFDFARPSDHELPELPDMSHATAQPLVIVGLPPVTLPEAQALPRQDPGVRYSRPLPYVLHAHAAVGTGELEVRFENAGSSAAVFHVYDRLHLDRLPRRYTVEASKSLHDAWSCDPDGGQYDLQVLGPNGFLRAFTGGPHAEPLALPEVRLKYHPMLGALELVASNRGAVSCRLDVTPNVYPGDAAFALSLAPLAGLARRRFSVRSNGNWYDFTVRTESLPGWSRRLAGRMETGRASVTDPALGMG